MKAILRKTIAMLLVCLMVLAGAQTAFADEAPPNPMYLPLRPVFESAGAEVYWDAQYRQVIVELGDDELVFAVGTNNATKNGVAFNTSFPVIMSENRTLISYLDVAFLFDDGDNDFSNTIASIVNQVYGFLPAVTGVSVAVVDVNTGFTWTHGFGFADTQSGRIVDEHTMFNLASISKPITSIAILQLYEQGILDLDEPIVTYLPQFSLLPGPFGGDYRNITARMLMSHTSGMVADFRGHGTSRIDGYDSQWFNNLLDTLSNYPMQAVENTVFHYNNHAFNVLGILVASLTGEDNFFDDFISFADENIFAPLGMLNTTFYMGAEHEHLMAYPYANAQTPIQRRFFNGLPTAGVFSSAHDMALLMQMLLNGGELNGVRILSEESVELLTSTHDFDFSLSFNGWRYSVGLYHISTYLAAFGGVFSWWGHGGDLPPYHSHIAFNFASGIGVFVTTNSSTGNGPAVLATLGGITTAIFESGRLFALNLAPSAIDADAEPVDMNMSELEGFVGMYLGFTGFRVVSYQNGNLYISRSENPGVRALLTPMSDGTFDSQFGRFRLETVEQDGEQVHVLRHGAIPWHVEGIMTDIDGFLADGDFMPFVGTFAAQTPQGHFAAANINFAVDDFGIAYIQNVGAAGRTPIRNVDGIWWTGATNVVLSADGNVQSFTITGMDFVRQVDG